MATTGDIREPTGGTMAPDVTTSKELDYRPKVIEHSTYLYNRIVPVSGGQTVTLQPAGTTECSFEFPSRVFNFARSRLEFTVRVIASGANRTTGVHAIGWSMIDRISLYTRNGVYLTDINNFNTVTELTHPYTTTKHDLVTNKGYGLPDSVGPASSLPFEGLQTARVTFVGPGSMEYTPAGGEQVAYNIYPATDNSVSRHFDSPRYLLNCNDNAVPGGVALNRAFNLNCCMSFKDIAHSLLATDKSLYFGEILVLRIQFAPINKIGFTWVSVAGGGANIYPSDIANSNPQILPATSITGLTMYVAMESNRQVAESVIRFTASQGMRLLVPYMYTYKYTSNATDQISVQQRLNRGHGRSLLKVYHSVYLTDETLISAYDHSNTNYALGERKVREFWTTLDNDRLQESNLIADSTDWQFIKPKITDSCITAIDLYAFHWVWIDDWTGKSTTAWKETDVADCGISLDAERQWAINELVATDAAAVQRPYTTYTVFVVQKLLTVTPSQITLI